MDLGEVWYIARETSSLDEKNDSIVFQFSNPPKDCHGGWHYWDDAEEGDYYTKKLIIDEHWTLGVIPNI